MLKYLAILAVLVPLTAVGILASHYAPKGTPEQRIAKPDSGQSGQQQAETSQDKHTAPNPTIVHPQPAAQTCDEACQQGRENLKIQGELALFTGLLVAVGVLQFAVAMLQVGAMIWQARLLKQTREDIHTQAEWMKTQTEHIGRQADMAERQARLISTQANQMEKQTEILRDSVTAAKESADAANAQIKMMKAKERARLTIEPPEPFAKIEIDNPFSEMEIRISNFGYTHAFNVRVGAWCEITKSEAEEEEESVPSTAVNTVRANADPEKIRVTVASALWNEFQVGAKDLFVHLSGRVEYEDVFGDRHFTRFRYFFKIWRLGRLKGEEGATFLPVLGGKWVKCPHQEHNQET
jgi:hypothetical protein